MYIINHCHDNKTLSITREITTKLEFPCYWVKVIIVFRCKIFVIRIFLQFRDLC